MFFLQFCTILGVGEAVLAANWIAAGKTLQGGCASSQLNHGSALSTSIVNCLEWGHRCPKLCFLLIGRWFWDRLARFWSWSLNGSLWQLSFFLDIWNVGTLDSRIFSSKSMNVLDFKSILVDHDRCYVFTQHRPSLQLISAPVHYT